MRIIEKIKRNWRYRRTWGTPVGQDCISLDTALCRWLGQRLLFMAEHTNSHDPAYTEDAWKDTLAGHAISLLRWADRYGNDWPLKDEIRHYEDAQAALRWCAANLASLWD
jgi:hypothetical protein